MKPLLPTFRKSKFPKFNATLPVEIWAMVIHYVLDSLSVPNTYCQPAKACTRHFGVVSSSKEDWCSIRLVCHAWAQLSRPWNQLCIWEQNVRFAQIVDKPDAGRLMFLSLKEDLTGNAIKLLLDNSSSLPNIRSLTLRFTRGDRNPAFWPRLSKGYPLLEYLCLSILFQPTEVITFKHLKSLAVLGWYHHSNPSTGGFYLPSLRNLTAAGSSELLSVLREYGTQLHALTLHAIHGPLDRAIWDHIPQLSVLDMDYQCLDKIGPTPAGHPLQRLCVHRIPHGWRQLDNLHQILSDFPGISEFIITDTLVPNSVRRSVSWRARRRGKKVTVFSGQLSYDVPWYKYLYRRSRYIHRKTDVLFLPFVTVILFIFWSCALLVLSVREGCLKLILSMRNSRLSARTTTISVRA